MPEPAGDGARSGGVRAGIGRAGRRTAGRSPVLSRSRGPWVTFGAAGGRWLAPALVVLTVLVTDRLSKSVVQGWLADRPADRRVDLAGDWLGLQYVENRGGAFGTLSGYGGVLTVVALVVIALIVIAYVRSGRPSAWLQVGIGLLVGGAIGNVLDRLTLGYVVDFVAVGPWPRFNVADSAITVGVLLLAWRLGGDQTGAAPTPPRSPGGVETDPRSDTDRRDGRPSGSHHRQEVPPHD